MNFKIDTISVRDEKLKKNRSKLNRRNKKKIQYNFGAKVIQRQSAVDTARLLRSENRTNLRYNSLKLRLNDETNIVKILSIYIYIYTKKKHFEYQAMVRTLE